jgi:hypothetical protein
MDDTDDEEIEYIIFNIGIFCKGSISLRELEEMPLSKVLRYNEYANRINKDVRRESDKHQGKI